MTDQLVRRQAANLAADVRSEIDRQLKEWNAILQQVTALPPGDQDDQTIIACLKAGTAIIDSLQVQLGGVHGWTLRARHALFQQAQRLLPKERADFTHSPAWTEQR